MQESDIRRLYIALSVIEDSEKKRSIEQKLDALAILGDFFWHTDDLSAIPYIKEICTVLDALMADSNTPRILDIGIQVVFALLGFASDKKSSPPEIERIHTDLVINNLAQTPSRVFFAFNLNCVHQLYMAEEIDLTLENMMVISDIWTRNRTASGNRQVEVQCNQIASAFYAREARQKMLPPLSVPPPSHLRFGPNPPSTTTTISFNDNARNPANNDNEASFDLSGLQGLQKANLAKVEALSKQIKREKNQTSKFSLLQRLVEDVRKGEFGLYECEALNAAVDVLLNHTRRPYEDNPVLRKNMITLLAKDLEKGNFSHNPKIQDRVIDTIIDRCYYADDIEQFSACIDLKTAFEKGNFEFTTDHLDRLARLALEDPNESVKTIAQDLYEGKKPETPRLKAQTPKP